ncbi:MAG TPA: hypothetical protein VK549_00995, partial [Acidimicrobiia bacterium]|nr:hypothetical protein [Acidimicrobiia bacterium]
LVLTGPIVYRRSGGESETMPSAWDRLALPLVDLAEVWTRPARVDDTDDNDQNDKDDDARSNPPSAAQSRWSRHSREQSNAAAPAPKRTDCRISWPVDGDAHFPGGSGRHRSRLRGPGRH